MKSGLKTILGTTLLILIMVISCSSKSHLKKRNERELKRIKHITYPKLKPSQITWDLIITFYSLPKGAKVTKVINSHWCYYELDNRLYLYSNISSRYDYSSTTNTLIKELK